MFIRSFLILCLLLLQPLTAFAYSYGDPNKEEVAETYKEIASRLEKSPEDWAGALSAFNSRKAEIALEFGKAAADTLEANLVNKQKDLVIHNYRAVLVKNVERRLKSAEKEFEDYAKAKLMLAKGRGTFQVLDPSVGDAASKKVYDAFDKALNALGNPGLFGVGVIPANKQEFQAQKNVILSTLKPLYAIKAAPAQQKPEAAKPGTTAQPVNPAKPVASKPAQPQTAKPAVPQPVQQPAATQSTGKPEVQPAAQPQTAQPTTAPADPNAQPSTAPAPASEQPAAQPQPSAEQPASSETTAPPASTDSSTETAADSTTATAPAAQTQPAPAESKVNPVVTVSVIGGILLIAGGAFWLGKRKGLL